MVAKIATGKSIRGVLNYNESKVENAQAQLLLACGFPRHHHDLSFKNKLARFDKLTAQNAATKTNALHISLNFSKDDQLNTTLLQKIAMDYMDRIGFGDQPYLVYQHYDASHPHLHIATVNIADGGQRIETHNIGKNQSEKARKEIEQLYGLIKAEDHSSEHLTLLKPGNLSSTVRDVVGSYRYTSLPELNAVLMQFGFKADRGEPGSKMFEKGGLIYYAIDEKGEQIGRHVKASSIYGSPTLKNLEVKFAANKISRKPYGVRLRHLLDKATASAKNIADFQARLQVHGIRILLRENVQGNIYGLSFIDNATRVVYNGSDLGKSYSAASFLDRLNKFSDGTKNQVVGQSRIGKQPVNKAEQRPVNAGAKYPAAYQSVMVSVVDIAFSSRHKYNEPDPLVRKKKRIIQQE